MVKDLGDRGGTVVYSTHQLSEAQRICNRIIMIHNGKIVADGSPDVLLSQHKMNDLEELYVSLTQEDAILHLENTEKESKISQLWRQFMTKTKRIIKEEEE